MRKPYDRILVISIVITVLYFWLIDKPTTAAVQDDKNMVFFGVLYVVLIFGILSLIYLCFKDKQ